MIINTYQIKGIGRGREIGFPTVNLFVPEGLQIDEGVYAVWVVINGITYKGALHYGPIPTFDLKTKSMEVHLVDITDDNFPHVGTDSIEIDFVQKIREVKNFLEVSLLVEQIALDVEKVKLILK